MIGILLAMLIVGAVGCVIGFFLCIADEKLKVEVDEREEAVLEALPGNNCGACGFPGCSGLAAAIAKGEARVNQCPVGGEPVAEIIAQIMGVEAEASTKMVAYVRCNGTNENAKALYNYTGVPDCVAAGFVPGGGGKACKYGCTGLGSCVKACEFDAIHVINGVSRVDKEKCVACEKCIQICPKNLIELVPYDSREVVTCMNKDKGKDVMPVCTVGCIGCGICAKKCPKDAIVIENNLAHIDQDKCIGCGICARNCPKKSIEIIPKTSGNIKTA